MTQFTRRSFVLAAAALTLSACTGVMPEVVPAGDNRPESLTPEQITAAVNAVRRANGHKPWSFNPRLAAAAKAQSNLMAQKNQLSHDLGVTLRQRVTTAGYMGAVGENLAGGHRNIEHAIEGWLNSSGHRSTLLSDKFVEFGLAVTRAPGGKLYWTLIAGGSFDAWRVYV